MQYISYTHEKNVQIQPVLQSWFSVFKRSHCFSMIMPLIMGDSYVLSPLYCVCPSKHKFMHETSLSLRLLFFPNDKPILNFPAILCCVVSFYLQCSHHRSSTV